MSVTKVVCLCEDVYESYFYDNYDLDDQNIVFTLLYFKYIYSCCFSRCFMLVLLKLHFFLNFFCYNCCCCRSVLTEVAIHV